MYQDENQELNKNFSPKPYVKKLRGRPRKNLLKNLKIFPLKQKEREVDQENKEIQRRSQTKLESRSDSDPDYLDYLKQTEERNRKVKNAKKPKEITKPESKKSKIIFQPQKIKSTTLNAHKKKIMEKMTKKITERILKIILKKIPNRISNRILKKILKTILRKIMKGSLKKTMQKTWKNNLKSLILKKFETKSKISNKL